VTHKLTFRDHHRHSSLFYFQATPPIKKGDRNRQKHTNTHSETQSYSSYSNENDKLVHLSHS